MRALQLFGLTMGILLAPKFLGLILALIDGPVRRACGGALRLVLSSLIEILLSALIAPIAMLIQSGSVFQILVGARPPAGTRSGATTARSPGPTSCAGTAGTWRWGW